MNEYIEEKKKYIEPELEILKFEATNIILSSGDGDDEDEKDKITVTDWWL